MFNSYLIDTVVIKSVSTTDKWNVKTYTSKSVKARVEYKTRLVRDIQGEQVVSMARVFFKPDQAIAHSDLIVFDSIEHKVISVGKEKDLRVRSTYADVA